MAVKDQTVKGVSVSQFIDKAKVEMGDDIGSIGGEWNDTERIPTGIFEFDIATGGGFPRGKVSLIFGNESSTKTVHAVLAIAAHQRLWPEKICAYVALEGYSQTDKAWFAKLGVDVERLAVFIPTYAEQVVDIMDSLCWSNDIGLIVLDSLAAMMSVTEFENSAEKKSMGGVSIPVTTMGRKTTAALNKSPSRPTIIYINQPRTKVGIAYGDPTKLPGGDLVNKFQPGMIVRLYGKNEMDTKYSKTLPVRKAVTMTLMKWKVPILVQASEYQLTMIAHNGLRPGQTHWFNSFKTYAQALGLLTKAEGKGAKGWDCFGQNWPTLDVLKTRLYSDPELADAVTQDIINALAENQGVIDEMDGADA